LPYLSGHKYLVDPEHQNCPDWKFKETKVLPVWETQRWELVTSGRTFTTESGKVVHHDNYQLYGDGYGD